MITCVFYAVSKLISRSLYLKIGDGGSQSVQRLVTGWKVRISNPGRDKNFYVFQNVHTGSVAQIAFYLIGTVTLPRG